MAHAHDELILCRVLAILQEPTLQSPLLVLHDMEENRILPIWVGMGEARAIAISLQETDVSRPLTHMLVADLIDGMDGELFQVVIDRIEAQTFYAALYIDVGKKKPLVIDSRPSDAVAIALELDVPIYVAKSVLDSAGQDNPFPEVEEPFVGLEEEVVSVTPDASPDLTRFTPAPPKVEFDDDELHRLQSLLEHARENERLKGDDGDSGGKKKRAPRKKKL